MRTLTPVAAKLMMGRSKTRNCMMAVTLGMNMAADGDVMCVVAMMMASMQAALFRMVKVVSEMGCWWWSMVVVMMRILFMTAMMVMPEKRGDDDGDDDGGEHENGKDDDQKGNKIAIGDDDEDGHSRLQ